MKVLRVIRRMNGISSWIEIIFIFQILWRCGEGLPDTIRVGALFEDSHKAQRTAFEYAVEKINLHKNILEKTLLVYDVQDVPPQDSFQAYKTVCRQIGQGVAAIFGPISSLSAAHVQSICNSYEIPHLQTHWDPRDIRDYFSISLYPHYLTLSKAYRDLISYWKWDRFTILYEDNDGLIRMQEILKGNESLSYRITVRKLEPLKGKYVELFKDLKDRGETRFVIDCHYKKCGHILKEALQVQMMSAYFHYHFTTLDIDLINLEDYKYGHANITAFRLIDPHRELVSDLIFDWTQLESKRHKSPLMGQKFIETEVALMYDAVHLFARALHELSQAQEIHTLPFSCSTPGTWTHGNSLLNYMKSIDFEGVTGRIHYEDGERSDFSLDIVQLRETGLQKIGEWSNKTNVNITSLFEKNAEIRPKIENKTLKIAVLEDKPYVMAIKDSNGNVIGYEGFAIDLLKNISRMLKFNYTMYHVKDKKFGDNDTGEWNGLIRELIEKNADLAISSLTITYIRDYVVDFTKPFLTLGITILYKKPEKSPPELFSFLQPLSIEVWVYMLAAYLCVSFMLFVIARFSPYEWCNPHPCNPDEDTVENQFSILNSLWFTIGSLMQQGCEIAPRAISTRMVSAIWWFFTLIMISSYTANLAAFLTVERMVSPITNADDLAKQTAIKYGSLAGGSTKKFFQNSPIPTYKKMWNFMKIHEEDVFVQSATEGVKRVKDGGYAYLAESTSVEYVVERNCDLMQVGSLLDSKGYGIATPEQSPYRDDISHAILKLSENQDIHKLKIKWWKEKNKNGTCEQEKKASKTTELSVDNVGGVFVVLVIGVVGGFIVAVCEFIWKARKNAAKDEQSVCSEMTEEFRFAIRCCGSTKKTNNKNKSKEAVVDNGLQFMPLTGYSSHNAVGPREVYA